jgi:hypothetical protein
MTASPLFLFLMALHALAKEQLKLRTHPPRFVSHVSKKLPLLVVDLAMRQQHLA